MKGHDATNSQNERFFPENVDEQIESLSQAHSQQDLQDLHLLQDLHAIHKEYVGTRDRVWARLEEHIVTAPVSVIHRQNESKYPMQHIGFSTQNRTVQRLGLVAALLFAALLTGSMFWMLTLARQPGGTAAPAPANMQSRTQNNLPQKALPSGVYTSIGGSIVMLDPQTGKRIWQHTFGIPQSDLIPIPKIVPAGDTLYVALNSFTRTFQSEIVALDANSGKVRWTYVFANPKPNELDLSGPDVFVNDGTVYASVQAFSNQASPPKAFDGYDGIVYALNAVTGKEQARYYFASKVQKVTVEKHVLFVSTENGLYATDLSANRQLWSIPITSNSANGAVNLSTPYVVNGLLYIAISNQAAPLDSYVAAFNINTGKEQWRSPTIPGQIFDIAVANDIVYMGTTVSWQGQYQGTLYAYDAQKGTQIWRHDTVGAIESAPLVADGTVYVPTYRIPAGELPKNTPEDVIALNATNGHELWKVQVRGGMMTTPQKAHDAIYLASGTFLYALRASSGLQIWQVSLKSKPQTIAVVG